MLLLFVALFNSILGLSILFPVLAPLGRELHLSEAQVGALSAVYALMQFALSPFWGKQSDARGRKPILLIGIVGFAIGFFAFGIVAQLGIDGALSPVALFALLLATRALGGALSAATMPTAQALAADLSERDKRTSAMAVIGMAFGAGIICGPGIGAAVVWLTGNLLAPVFVSASVAVVNAIFVAAFLREPARRETRPPLHMWGVARALWPLLAVAFVTTLASVAMEQTVAFYFQDRLHLTNHETPLHVGLALCAYGVIAVGCQGGFVRRTSWRPISLVRVGIPIALAGYVLFIFAHEHVLLIGALLLQGLGSGLAIPGVTSALSLGVGDEDQGSVAGLNSSAQSLGRTIGPVVGPLLYELRPIELPYAFSAVLLGLVLIVVLAYPGVARSRA